MAKASNCDTGMPVRLHLVRSSIYEGRQRKYQTQRQVFPLLSINFTLRVSIPLQWVTHPPRGRLRILQLIACYRDVGPLLVGPIPIWERTTFNVKEQIRPVE